jgi:hypothetical protein
MTTQLPVGKTGQHGFTLVDDEDADVAGGRVISRKTAGTGYCHIQHYYSKGKDAQLHRLIAERMLGRPLLKKEVVDHRDGQPFNNQRSNLRICSQRKNCQNHASHRNGRLVGTCFHKASGKWMANIRIDGKRKFLGYFLTEAEAHNAYMEEAATKEAATLRAMVATTIANLNLPFTSTNPEAVDLAIQVMADIYEASHTIVDINTAVMAAETFLVSEENNR